MYYSREREGIMAGTTSLSRWESVEATEQVEGLTLDRRVDSKRNTEIS